VAPLEASPVKVETPTGSVGVRDFLTPARFALVLAALVLATFPGVLTGASTFIIRDFGLFSYPVAAFQKECFWRGELPSWNPYSFCGLPFLAQWNTLALYPLAIIYLVAPLTWSLPFFCLLHLYWGGVGMYGLARAWTQDNTAGALAGVLFAFNGLTLNFLMWPSHIATLSWVPWALWAAPEGWRKGGRHLFVAVAVLSLQFLAGGPETILLTWLVLLIAVAADVARARASRLGCALRFAGIGTLTFLLCAPQWLPFVELLWRSQRDSGYGGSVWSMPAHGLANFLVPLFRTRPTSQGVFFQPEQGWTSSYYAGTAAVGLCIVAVARSRSKTALGIAVFILAGLWLALGDPGGLYGVARQLLPPLGFLRYPVKFVLVATALVPLLAAVGWHACRRKADQKPWLEIAVAGSILLAIGAIAMAEWTSVTTRWNAFARALSFACFSLVASLPYWRPKWGRPFVQLAVVLLCWLDMSTHAPNQNPLGSPQVYSEGWVDAQQRWQPRPSKGETRLYLAPAAHEALKYRTLPSVDENFLLNRLAALGNCNLIDRVSQAHGFFSLVPAEINNLTAVMALDTNAVFGPLLDFMGVAHTNSAENPFAWQPRATALPLVTAGQEPVFSAKEEVFKTVASTNFAPSAQVWLEPEIRSRVAASATPATIKDLSFGLTKVSFTVEAPAPSMVVIAQTFYPEWRLLVDGEPRELWRANYAFQALQVPAGKHQVLLTYQDRRLLAGLCGTGLGVLLIGFMLVRQRTKPANAI
jgi:hypothetical protein